MITDTIRAVLDAQQALHMARFTLWRENKFFYTGAEIIDYRAEPWGIHDGALYVARPLELAKETHVLNAGGFDDKDIYDVPETNIVAMRVRDAVDTTYLFSRDLRDDHYFRGECGVIFLCDASGRVVKNLHFSPSFLMQRKPSRIHPFVMAMRRVTGLSDLEFDVTPLQNAARSILAVWAFVCQYADGEGWSSPDLCIIRRDDNAKGHIRSVVEFGGRVLDPRALPGFASGEDDATIRSEES